MRETCERMTPQIPTVPSDKEYQNYIDIYEEANRVS